MKRICAIMPEDCSGARIKLTHRNAIRANGTITVVQSILSFKDSEWLERLFCFAILSLLSCYFIFQTECGLSNVQKWKFIIIIEHYNIGETEMQAKKVCRSEEKFRSRIKELQEFNRWRSEPWQENYVWVSIGKNQMKKYFFRPERAEKLELNRKNVSMWKK